MGQDVIHALKFMNNMVVTREEEERRVINQVKGIYYMVMDGNDTFGGDHNVVYTDVKL